jgi:hypothetical protein
MLNVAYQNFLRYGVWTWRKTMKDLSPFYIQKVLSQIARPVKNASRLHDRTLLVGTKIDEQSKKLLKQKLLGSYHVLVEKHRTLRR